MLSLINIFLFFITYRANVHKNIKNKLVLTISVRLTGGSLLNSQNSNFIKSCG